MKPDQEDLSDLDGAGGGAMDARERRRLGRGIRVGRPVVRGLPDVPHVGEVPGLHDSAVYPLRDRIAFHEAALAELRQQQRDLLWAAIVEAFPCGVFSTEQVWQQPELQVACREVDITTAQQLGVWLGTWRGAGLDWVTRNNRGHVWSVSADDLHQPSGVADEDSV